MYCHQLRERQRTGAKPGGQQNAPHSKLNKEKSGGNAENCQSRTVR